MSIETVARRYSIALADVVIQKDEIEQVKTELKTWEELINSSNELLQAFSYPSISHSSKVGLLESLIEETKSSTTTANFLRILLKNGRLTEIGEINKRFSSVLDERKGVVTGRITSARELTEAEKSELLESFLKLTGKQVKLDYRIDENIIGGVVARIGSTIYDGSVRTQLEELRDKLVNG